MNSKLDAASILRIKIRKNLSIKLVKLVFFTAKTPCYFE